MIDTSKEVYEFYCQCKLNPKWAVEHVDKKSHRRPSIDRIINLNGGQHIYRNNYPLAALNLCALLKINRDRREPGDLHFYLRHLARKPGTIIDSAKRAAFAARWYNRMVPKEFRITNAYHGVPLEYRYKVQV